MKLFFVKYCKTMFFAYIVYALALTASRNTIVVHVLKLLYKTREKNV